MEQTEALARAEEAALGVERPPMLYDPCVMQVLQGLQDLAREQQGQAQDWSRYYVDRSWGPETSTFGPYDDLLDAVHVAMREQARLRMYRHLLPNDDEDSDGIWIRPACLDPGEGVVVELKK